MEKTTGEHNGAITPEQRHALSAFWKGSVNWDVSMGDYCTLRAGGRTDALLVASSVDELQELIRWLAEHDIAWRVIGRGSNVLVSGKGFRGALIILGGEFSVVNILQSGDDLVKIAVGAGCPVSRLIAWCGRNSLSGLEFMSGIPGSVGGAVVMNAGAWGREIGEFICSVSVIDKNGIIHILPADAIDFGYRRMRPRDEQLSQTVVFGAELKLYPGRQRDIFEQCRQYQEQRRTRQPIGIASAGSFFKNPEGDSAGRLIEAAGLKGLRRGNAMVSTVHANFIVNTGHATADDIITLMREVQEKVFDFSGIMLEPEVHLL